MNRKMKALQLAIAALIMLAINTATVLAAASFETQSFSCSPSENVINSIFSCTSQVKNVGDVSGSVSTATLYPDSNNWLESSSYAQASGTSVSPGQTTDITFTGLKAVRSGNNGFTKIMLDQVTDTYVADNNKRVNIIDVLVSVTNSVSSAAMNANFDSTTEVTAGGNIDVILTFTVNSGGCSIGSQDRSQTISGMQDGNRQSRTWTVTQGTSGSCSYTVSASATGSGGVASKIDSSSSSVTCSDCTSDSGGSSGTGSGGGGTTVGGGGGAGGKTYIIGELTTSQLVELAKGDRAKFNISGEEYSLLLSDFSASAAQITLVDNKGTRSYLLQLGERLDLDLNRDGTVETYLKLKSIDLTTGKATFILSKIKESQAQEKPEEEKSTVEKITEAIRALKSSKSFKLAAAIILASLAILSLVYYLAKRSKRKHMQYDSKKSILKKGETHKWKTKAKK